MVDIKKKIVCMIALVAFCLMSVRVVSVQAGLDPMDGTWRGRYEKYMAESLDGIGNTWSEETAKFVEWDDLVIVVKNKCSSPPYPDYTSYHYMFFDGDVELYYGASDFGGSDMYIRTYINGGQGTHTMTKVEISDYNPSIHRIPFRVYQATVNANTSDVTKIKASYIIESAIVYSNKPIFADKQSVENYKAGVGTYTIEYMPDGYMIDENTGKVVEVPESKYAQIGYPVNVSVTEGKKYNLDITWMNPDFGEYTDEINVKIDVYTLATSQHLSDKYKIEPITAIGSRKQADYQKHHKAFKSKYTTNYYDLFRTTATYKYLESERDVWDKLERYEGYTLEWSYITLQYYAFDEYGTYIYGDIVTYMFDGKCFVSNGNSTVNQDIIDDIGKGVANGDIKLEETKSITDMLKDAPAIVGSVTEFFANFLSVVGVIPAMLGRVFFFIPSNVQMYIGAGITICVLIGIVRFIRG